MLSSLVLVSDSFQLPARSIIEMNLKVTLVLDTMEFRNVVLWLEDQKIRHYKIEDRKALRDINSSDWPKTFRKYRDDLACPVQSEKSSELLEWLLAFAVRLEYADNGK
jgi:RLL motif-containing protein 1